VSSNVSIKRSVPKRQATKRASSSEALSRRRCACRSVTSAVTIETGAIFRAYGNRNVVVLWLSCCYTGCMRQALKVHPDSLYSAVTHIEVEIMRPCAGSLDLSYLVTGSIGDIRLAPAVAAARTDELWRHTCFEAFVRTSLGPAYYEFNFAPSTQWAAYRFDNYRSGLRVATEISALRIDVQSSRACYRMQASLELDQMSILRVGRAWRIGLAAVIEETSGHKSYWALTHPPGKADFHHSDSFALEFS
jgi:hypothetical protein